MKTAIDCSKPGQEFQVSAPVGSTIPATCKWYKCASCDEYVTLVVSGFFRHQNRTPETIECEERVNSYDYTPYKSYQSLGLAIYLQKRINNDFKLYFAFPPVSERSLNIAQDYKAKVIIRESLKKPSEKNVSSFLISTFNFFSDRSTMIPIEFMPINSGLFEIEFIENIPQEIEEKWPQKSDLFHYNGIFFEYGKEIGKKIRNKGSIVTDKDYYFITLVPYKVNLQGLKGIEIEVIGDFEIDNIPLFVYRVKICTKDLNDENFLTIKDLIYESFQLTLFKKPSKLIPLWPPFVSINDEHFSCAVQMAVSSIFIVKSATLSPDVYQYDRVEEKNHRNAKLIKTESNENLVRIFLKKTPIVCMVDRYFFNVTTNILLIDNNTPKIKTYIASIVVKDRQNKLIGDTVHKFNKITISTNLKAKIIKEFKNRLLHETMEVSSPEEKLVKDLSRLDRVFIYSNSWRLLHAIDISREKLNQKNHSSDDLLFSNLLIKCHGQQIKTPLLVQLLYIELRTMPLSRDVLRLYIARGTMPKKALILLKTVGVKYV